MKERRKGPSKIAFWVAMGLVLLGGESLGAAPPEEC